MAGSGGSLLLLVARAWLRVGGETQAAKEIAEYTAAETPYDYVKVSASQFAQVDTISD